MAEMNGALSPLGVFGLWSELPLQGAVLRPLMGALDPETRSKVADYLRRGTAVFAFMAHSRDVLDHLFEVPGGPGIWTDGSYFYRYEAIEYIAHYGIQIPSTALAMMSANEWSPASVDPDRLEEMRKWIVRNK